MIVLTGFGTFGRLVPSVLRRWLSYALYPVLRPQFMWDSAPAASRRLVPVRGNRRHPRSDRHRQAVRSCQPHADEEESKSTTGLSCVALLDAPEFLRGLDRHLFSWRPLGRERRRVLSRRVL